MKYREKQDKWTFLTAALKSRNLQGIYFSSENLELYSCSLHSAEIPVFCRSTERALGPFDRQLCLQNWVFEGNAPINVNPVRGRGECGQGEGMGSGFWSCEATPGSGHLTLIDRSLVFLVSIQKWLPGPFLEAFWKSRCWRKVWSFHLF